MFTEYVCYDDGCHLKKYATNPKRANHTATAKKIASMNIVIDKLHYKGHTDAWCKKHCDPYKFDGLNKVCASIPCQKDCYIRIYNLGRNDMLDVYPQA